MNTEATMIPQTGTYSMDLTRVRTTWQRATILVQANTDSEAIAAATIAARKPNVPWINGRNDDTVHDELVQALQGMLSWFHDGTVARAYCGQPGAIDIATTKLARARAVLAKVGMPPAPCDDPAGCGESLQNVLKRVEAFIAGFEGDELQEGVDGLLADLRQHIA